MCEICENALFVVNGLNKKLYPESRLPTTINELVARFSCEDVEKCMLGKCEKCSSKTLPHEEDFNVNLIADSEFENSNTSDSDCDDNDQTAIVAFYKWALEGTKLKKMLFKESIDSAIQKFTSTTTTTVSKTAWVGTTYLFMLTTVRAKKRNISMRYRAPTSAIRHLVYLPHIVTFEILKITL